MPKLGMDAVGRDDEVGFGNDAILERCPGDVAVLLKAGAPVPGVHHVSRQGAGQDVDEVGAVHAERCVPARRVRHLDRSDGRPVVAEDIELGTDPGSPLLHRRSESHPLQLAHAVRCQEHPGADLAEGTGLLIDRPPKAVGDQRGRSEQASDSLPTITTFVGDFTITTSFSRCSHANPVVQDRAPVTSRAWEARRAQATLQAGKHKVASECGVHPH